MSVVCHNRLVSDSLRVPIPINLARYPGDALVRIEVFFDQTTEANA
jgi:hypothetical protein